MRLLAYYRVSTDKQEDSGLGLAAQKSSVEAHAASRGDEIVGEVTEIASGGKDDRALLGSVLEALRKGEADGLIVAKLDRLARSIVKVDDVMRQATRYGWDLVIIDMGMDTSTPVGRLAVNIIASVAQFEREQIGLRTREALQAKKRRDGFLKGNKPSVCAETVEMIRDLREQGFTYRAIAERLEADGVPTAQGGRWRGGTVRYIAHAADSE